MPIEDRDRSRRILDLRQRDAVVVPVVGKWADPPIALASGRPVAPVRSGSGGVGDIIADQRVRRPRRAPVGFLRVGAGARTGIHLLILDVGPAKILPPVQDPRDLLSFGIPMGLVVERALFVVV